MDILIDLTHLVMSWRGAALGAALGWCADCLGLFAPGAKRKKTPEEERPRKERRNWRLDLGRVCACIRYPAPDGTMIDGNCGRPVCVQGAVRVKDKHVPPPGYDHEAIMAPYRALGTQRRRARREREVEAMTASIEAVSGRRGAAEGAGDAPTYQDARDIFAANGDILLNHDYCVYVGLTKQSLRNGLRGEQGRFLTQSRERTSKSTNTPMVQLARINQRTMHWAHLEQAGFEWRSVYRSQTRMYAAIIEEVLQGEFLLLVVSVRYLYTLLLLPGVLAPRGAPLSLVRDVAAGGRGKAQYLKDMEEGNDPTEWHHVFITFIPMKKMMEMLTLRQWKLHMRDGDLLTSDISEDMIVCIGNQMQEILIKFDDETQDEFLAATADLPVIVEQVFEQDFQSGAATADTLSSDDEVWDNIA